MVGMDSSRSTGLSADSAYHNNSLVQITSFSFSVIETKGMPGIGKFQETLDHNYHNYLL